jgi:endonuclease/exonuclease/phosphatase (EEP) superfamily protein YafD
LGEWHWFLDLFSHFRLLYLVVCAVVLGFALVRRRKWLIAAAVVSFGWNLALIAQVHRPLRYEDGATMFKPAFKVMTFNVLNENRRREDVIRHVLAADADILCLPEVNARWAMDLEPLRKKYAHYVEEMTQGDFGIACYTRLPMKSGRVHIYADEGISSIVMELEYEGKALTFIGTHPVPPMGSATARVWRTQLTQIGQHAASMKHDVILAGDLNATPWCHGMRLLQDGSGLEFRSAQPVWWPTWGLNLPLMMPIDHVMFKGDLIALKREIGPDLGSDHRSVLVEVYRRVEKD